VKIDLSHIDIEAQHFAEQLELSREALDPAQVAGPMTVTVEGVVRRVGDGLRAEGRVIVAGSVRCGRCLEAVAWRSDEAFAVDLMERPAGGEAALGEGDEREVVFVDRDWLDLSELAVEQVLLALPMRILCRDDCAGLCPRCGGNRNLPDGCRCGNETDPRWSALRDLRARLDPTPGEPDTD